METEEKRYWIQTGAMGTILLGAYLLIEHISVWGGTDPYFGHEWLGVILVILGAVAGLFSRKK